MLLKLGGAEAAAPATVPLPPPPLAAVAAAAAVGGAAGGGVPQVGAAFMSHHVSLPDGKTIKFEIW
jgi:hypothetical protein